MLGSKNQTGVFSEGGEKDYGVERGDRGEFIAEAEREALLVQEELEEWEGKKRIKQENLNQQSNISEIQQRIEKLRENLGLKRGQSQHISFTSPGEYPGGEHSEVYSPEYGGGIRSGSTVQNATINKLLEGESPPMPSHKHTLTHLSEDELRSLLRKKSISNPSIQRSQAISPVHPRHSPFHRGPRDSAPLEWEEGYSVGLGDIAKHEEYLTGILMAQRKASQWKIQELERNLEMDKDYQRKLEEKVKTVDLEKKEVQNIRVEAERNRYQQEIANIREMEADKQLNFEREAFHEKLEQMNMKIRELEKENEYKENKLFTEKAEMEMGYHNKINGLRREVLQLEGQLGNQSQMEKQISIMQTELDTVQKYKEISYDTLDEKPDRMSIHADNRKIRVLETDIQFLKRQIADANSQKTNVEIENERLLTEFRAMKDKVTKEIETKYINEIDELEFLNRALRNEKLVLQKKTLKTDFRKTEKDKNQQPLHSLPKSSGGNKTETTGKKKRARRSTSTLARTEKERKYIYPPKDKEEDPKQADKLIIIEKENEQLQERNYELSQDIHYLNFRIKNMQSLYDKENYDNLVEVEGLSEEADALNGMYERRCKNLSEAAIHWKKQARELLDTFYDSLQGMKSEYVVSKQEFGSHLREIKAKFKKQFEDLFTKHGEETEELKTIIQRLQIVNTTLSQKIASLRMLMRKNVGKGKENLKNKSTKKPKFQN